MSLKCSNKAYQGCPLCAGVQYHRTPNLVHNHDSQINSDRDPRCYHGLHLQQIYKQFILVA